MKVLIVEDDRQISDFISKGLIQANFTVDQAEDGDTGLYLARQNHYDVAIVDLMLPILDGLSLIESLRKEKINTPVLILSAKRSVDDRIIGLEKGGDDYLVKPFIFGELLARVHALIRRTSGILEPVSLSYADLTLDLLKREVARSGEVIELQPREFALLEYLLRNAERVLSKTLILERIWDYRFDPQTNVIDVLVSRLRSKIDRDFPTKLIHTIRGIGYVLKSSP